VGNRVPILCRVGSKLGTCTIPGTWKVLMPYDAHPSHESRDVHAPARIGLVVICGVFGEQSADPRPDGLETRHLRYPKYVEGGEAIRNPIRVTDPEVSAPSARVGLIAI